MADLTHEEADRRIREAMKPPTGRQVAGQGFSSGIQKMRQSARRRKPTPANRQLQVAG